MDAVEKQMIVMTNHKKLAAEAEGRATEAESRAIEAEMRQKERDRYFISS